MITLYDSLLETAQMDYQAANFLTNHLLFAHSIFYFSQSFEKGLKATYAYYAVKRKNRPENEVEHEIKGNFGHKHRKQTVIILNLLLDMDQQILKKEFDIHSSRSLDEAYFNLKRLEERHYLGMNELRDFHKIIKAEYNKKYKHLSTYFSKRRTDLLY